MKEQLSCKESLQGIKLINYVIADLNAMFMKIESDLHANQKDFEAMPNAIMFQELIEMFQELCEIENVLSGLSEKIDSFEEYEAMAIKARMSFSGAFQDGPGKLIQEKTKAIIFLEESVESLEMIKAKLALLLIRGHRKNPDIIDIDDGPMQIFWESVKDTIQG